MTEVGESTLNKTKEISKVTCIKYNGFTLWLAVAKLAIITSSVYSAVSQLDHLGRLQSHESIYFRLTADEYGTQSFPL